MISGTKKNKERKLLPALEQNHGFLVERLRKEWATAEKAARKEELYKQAKTTAKNAAKILLVLAGIAGGIVVMAVAPNIFAAVGQIVPRRRFIARREFRSSVVYLQKKKFITKEHKGEGHLIQLTEKGEKLFLMTAFKQFTLDKKERWDGKWHLVLFDIPNRHKWARDAFRDRLKVLEMYQVQESIFAFPFPCEEEIEYVAAILNIRPYVRFVVAEKLQKDDDLRSHFAVK